MNVNVEVSIGDQAQDLFFALKTKHEEVLKELVRDLASGDYANAIPYIESLFAIDDLRTKLFVEVNDLAKTKAVKVDWFSSDEKQQWANVLNLDSRQEGGEAA